jgi:hypothetical protein
MSDNDLLELAVEAKGGLSCWIEVSSIKVDVSITGGIWYVKGRPELKDIVMVIDTRQERVSTSFVGQDRHTVFEPDEVTVRGPAGIIDEVCKNPEESFTGQTAETSWDDVQVAYCNGEALWIHIITPFLFTQGRFKSEEIGSIDVESKTWRRLTVIFPEKVKTRTREQIFCYGQDGLLRRHDSTVDILGGATGLKFGSHYREIDGIMFPTKRRVFAYEGDFQRVAKSLLVGVDISRITKCLNSRPQHVDSPAGLA